MTDTPAAPAPGGNAEIVDLAEDTALVGLLNKNIEQVVKGKISLSDLFALVVGEGSLPEVSKAPPVPKALTDKERDAIRRLPEVYGSVIVQADRKLTPTEAKKLVEEREVVNTVLALLAKRKDESLREVFANHLDHLVPEEDRESARTDAKGHFAVKQDVPVDGTGMKIQRTVSGGKPKLTIQQVEDLHAEGKIDRKTYLAITKKPDLPRVLDESGLHRAIQKDPRLFFLLASAAEPTTPVTTIKVVKDS